MKEQQKDKNSTLQQTENDKPYKHSAFNEIKEEDQRASGNLSDNLPDNSPVIKSEESSGDVITKGEEWAG